MRPCAYNKKRGSKYPAYDSGSCIRRDNMDITIDELYEMYMADCRRRNLSSYSLRNYKDKYHVFTKTIDNRLKCSQVDKQLIDDWISELKTMVDNDVSINTYIRGIRPIMYYGMREGLIDEFKISLIREKDRDNKIPYNAEEVQTLLRRPKIKDVTFAELRTWTSIVIFLTTGIRLRSLIELRNEDVDLENNLLYINITKNGKRLVLPISNTLSEALTLYMRHRKGEPEDFLICTVEGAKIAPKTLQGAIKSFNKKRGIEKHSIHLFRHTFAREFLINGGNVLTLQKWLGHKTLEMSQKYVALYDTDLLKIENPIDKMVTKQRIKIR